MRKKIIDIIHVKKISDIIHLIKNKWNNSDIIDLIGIIDAKKSNWNNSIDIIEMIAVFENHVQGMIWHNVT